MEPRQTYALAAAGFVELVERLPGDRWEAPGLGVWDLRALVGHTSRALVTADSYLDRPASAEDITSPEAYFLAAAQSGGRADPTAVAERGRQAGAALGDDIAASVLTLAERVLSRVVEAGDPVIETIAGGMRLSTYLPTRTFELVVHSFDIAAAAEVAPPTFGADVLAEVAALAARVGVGRGQAADVILALTGRRPLPAEFSVL
ncbi:MAG: FIG00822982: hypothetical protein [uncultured Propionibacteriaceae bacterium]|uniref:Mycothiol-dependent maleylpyruvate isomerase metal-binding domain-containing protein n=1 Tax=uncultured Propionibacteriaceae bacterium TaxID=257457 RepID=A0A6J4NST6_9ACTN|nr:MAG: FIG00822982: hypothetical protein [uncultured Propionibacteriaceae bacterium]